jgi:hypothetical protein
MVYSHHHADSGSFHEGLSRKPHFAAPVFCQVLPAGIRGNCQNCQNPVIAKIEKQKNGTRRACGKAQYNRSGRNTSNRHGSVNILGIFRRALSRSAPSRLLKMTVLEGMGNDLVSGGIHCTSAKNRCCPQHAIVKEYFFSNTQIRVTFSQEIGYHPRRIETSTG